MTHEQNTAHFLATDRAEIAEWTWRIGPFGWETEVDPLDEYDDNSPETLFVMLPGGDEPAFHVCRFGPECYGLTDWRNGAAHSQWPSLRHALDAMFAAVAPGMRALGL